ncbi:unnamed protein product [Peniophora sp. CBMAI 1063]|nr:unnamed protein product [Peniophora sp. CBMAI 1063]
MPANSNDVSITSSTPLLNFERKEPGLPVWERYKKAVAVERQELGDYSTTTMTGVLTFAGLFAATVAAFLIESYKMLSPDSAAQSVTLLSTLISAVKANDTESINPDPAPFLLSNTSFYVNILWFVALVVSLVSGLLATLVQEWTRDLIRAQARLSDVHVEAKCIEHLGLYMGADNYGLHNFPSIVIGLMHAAVILFLVGLDMFLFPINRDLAIVLSAVSGAFAAAYIIASAFPIYDETCPYRTPMTDVLYIFFVIPYRGLRMLMAYIVYSTSAGMHIVKEGPLDVQTKRFLNPLNFYAVMSDPLTSKRAWRGAKVYAARRKTDNNTHFVPYITEVIRSGISDDEDPALLAPGQLVFVWDRIWEYALDHPSSLHYFGGVLAYAREPVIDSMFTGWRNEPTFVAKIAASLDDVASPYFASAALRMLQLLLEADSPSDQIAQAKTGGTWRWYCVEPIFEAFPRLAAKLDVFMGQALEDKDSTLPAALASFRLALLRLLTTTAVEPPDGGLSDGRNLIKLVFRELQRHRHTKLMPLAANETDNVEDLFDGALNPLLELSSRNALTLLNAAKSCDWYGPWTNPDERFLPKKAVGTFEWPLMNAGAVAERRRECMYPASTCFRDLLKDIGLAGWLQPGSQFPDPESGAFDPSFQVAIRALRDLASLVKMGTQLSGDASTEPVNPKHAALENASFDPIHAAQDPSEPAPSHGDPLGLTSSEVNPLDPPPSEGDPVTPSPSMTDTLQLPPSKPTSSVEPTPATEPARVQAQESVAPVLRRRYERPVPRNVTSNSMYGLLGRRKTEGDVGNMELHALRAGSAHPVLGFPLSGYSG